MDEAYIINARSCTVNGVFGKFHCWEHFSMPVAESPFVGGSPAGVFSRVYGIVEFADGVKRVEIGDIEFSDIAHANLCALARKEAADGHH